MIAVSVLLIALTAAGCAMSACAVGRLSLEDAEEFCRRALLLYLLGLIGIAVEIIV